MKTELHLEIPMVHSMLRSIRQILSRMQTRLLATLALALALMPLLVAAQPLQGQQPPPPIDDPSQFLWTVGISKEFVCVGGSAKITVVLDWQVPSKTSSGDDEITYVPVTVGKISAYVLSGGSGSGTISPLDQPLTMSGILKGEATATFTFKGTKVGKAQVSFDALVPQILVDENGEPVGIQRYYATTTIDVPVGDCKYKAGMIFHAKFGIAIHYIGMLENVTMTGDENGEYHGSGTFVYDQILGGIAVGDVGSGCEIMSTSLNPADVTGQFAADQIEVNFSFQDAQTSWSDTCPVSISSYFPQYDIAPPITSIWVDHASFPQDGGVAVFPSPVSQFPGTVTVFVTREVEGSAAQPAFAKPVGKSLAKEG